jgi:superfamily I DNA/RNA helicase
MDNRVVVAAAGSGKTTLLIQEALKLRQNVLITCYTQANEKEVEKKIISERGCIPNNITIQTWFSFLLQHGIRPFQNKIYDKDINGVNQVNSISGIKYMRGKTPVYYDETREFKEHYFDKSGKIYSDKIAKLACRCDSASNGDVIDRISRIYPIIFFDEIQDLAAYDLEFIKLLLTKLERTIIVGDPRQATFTTSKLQKNRQYRKSDIFRFFYSLGTIVSIDEDLLNTNHRCIAAICDLSNKIYEGYPKANSGNIKKTVHDGVFVIRNENLSSYLNMYNPIQLRDSIKTQVNKQYPAINFGESKGLTFNRVLIYPTKPIINWLLDNSSELAETSRAKLYVAVTRAENSVTFVCDRKIVDRICDYNGFEKYEI